MRIRFSEAIRLGSLLRPQAFHALFTENGSCALGAACEAIGDDGKTSRTVELWPWLWRKAEVACPSCGFRDLNVDIITHLNDEHHWSREAIADLVATIEPAEEPASERETSCPVPDLETTAV